MSTIADVATSNPVSVSPSSHAVEARSPDRRRSHFGEWLLGFVLLSGLATFNVWWYWRDTRPLPDYATVSDWIQREQYAKAEASLNERLRRSRHDFEARIMLARVMAARNDYLGCARELHEVPFWSPRKAEASIAKDRRI